MFMLVENGHPTRPFDWPCAVTIAGVEHPASIFGTPEGIALGILPVRREPIAYDALTQTAEQATVVRGDEVVITDVITDKPLAEAQAAVRAAIKAWRDAREFDPFPHDGKWFKGDVDSIRRLNGAAALAQASLVINAPFQEVWSTYTGAAYPIASAQAMLGIALAKGAAFSEAFAASRAALSLVEAATTAADCRAAYAALQTSHPVPVLLTAEGYERLEIRTNKFTRDVPVGQRFINLDA